MRLTTAPPGSNDPSDAHSSTSADVLIAASVGAAALGVYLRTIYPGVLAIGDATKFAFVGKILGTPHAPGYPLYVLVSHLFSYLPFGTLAYRMNVLSACFGAVTVSLGYLIARRLQVNRFVAAATAAGLGFGASFWATALYAKTYTLHAALVSLGVLMLLRWEQERQLRDLYLAAAVFALSVGNHLTVIALVPALLLFTLMTDAKTAFRPRTLAVMAVLLALGLSLYGLIIVRTLQHAPYLEARATNLSELWAVMTARRFAHEIGAYSTSALMAKRVPIVAALVGGELGLIGLPLLAIGLIALAVQRSRDAVLLGLGGFGVAALTANMSSEEDRGFLLAAFALLWPIAAFGLQWLVTASRRHSRALSTGLAACAVIGLPYSQLADNYRTNDHHTDTFERDYFNALFAALPDRSAIVNDEYRLNMLVLYKLLGENAANGRDIRLVQLDKNGIASLHRDGFAIFAFESARKDLENFGYMFEPYPLSTDPAVKAVTRQRDIFRLIAAPSCLEIGNTGWQDVAVAFKPKGRMTVRIDNYRPFDAELIVYAASNAPLNPAIIGNHGRGVPTLDVRVFKASDATSAADSASRDGVTLSEAVSHSAVITRMVMRVNDEGVNSTFGLDLGGGVVDAVAHARVDQDTPRRATVCSHPLSDAELFAPDAQQAVITPDSNTVAFDLGWYPTERRADGFTSRWTGRQAMLLVPIGQPRNLTLDVVAEPLRYANRPPGVTLVLNGHRLETRQVPSSRTTLTWTVPVTDVRAGLNELVFDVDGAAVPRTLKLSADTRTLGISVSRITVTAGSPSSR